MARSERYIVTEPRTEEFAPARRARWLWAIIVHLLLVPGYFDIALRDLGLSLGALALARLSPLFERERVAR